MRVRLRLVQLLGLRWLRVHILRTFLAWVAVTGGVSLALSVVVADTSVSWSFAHFSQKVAGGAELRVIGATARGGLEGSVLPKVAATDGVAAAIPAVEAITRAGYGSRSATVVVVGLPFISEYEVSPLLLGRLGDPAPSRVGTPARGGPPGGPRAREIAPAVELSTDQGPFSLFPATEVASLDGVAGGDVVFMPLRESQVVFARGDSLDAIYVIARRGASIPALTHRLQVAVGSWNGVVPAGSLPPEASIVTRSFLPLLGLLSILVVGVAMVLVHDIVDLALSERRRSMAVVAALGGRPAEVALPLVDALVVGVAGGLAGIAGGSAVAMTVLGTLNRLVHPLTGVPLTLHLGVATVVLAPLGGLVVAAVAAWGPYRRARRADISAELSERERVAEARSPLPLWRGAVTGLVAAACLVGCWASSWHGSLDTWQYPLGVCAFAFLVVFFMLFVGNLAPVALRGGAVLLSREGRDRGRSEPAGGRGASDGDDTGAGVPRVARFRQRPGVVARLALSNLARNPNRTGTMAIAVAGAVGLAFVSASFNRSFTDSILSSNLSRAHWVYVSMGSAAAVSIDTEDRFSPTELAALSRVRGVASVERQVGVVTGHSGGSVIGVETSDNLRPGGIPLIEGSASPSLLSAGEAIVGPVTARVQHLRPGSFVSLDTPTRIARVEVAGIWQNGDFNGASVFISEKEMTQLYGPQPPSNVYVHPVPGTTPAELVRRIEAAHIAPDLHASTPTQTAEAEVHAASSQIAPFWSLQRSLMGLSFVAVLSTLVLAGVQRRREYGALVAVGFAPSDLSRVVLVEGTAVGAVGAVLGGLVGVAGTAGIILITPLVIGYRDPYVVAPAYWLLYGAIGVAVTAVASLLPAWRAAHVPVLEALREE